MNRKKICLLVVCFTAFYCSFVFGDEINGNQLAFFDREPYVHPAIIKDLSTWLSDGGDQVVSINLLDSQHSNRYFGDIEVKEIKGKNPLVFYVSNEEGYQRFDYQYIGQTDSGIDVLYTADSGGGSGVFTSLMFVVFEKDKGISFDEKNLSIKIDRDRVLIKKLGEIPLGDRWDGELSIDGDKIFLGKDIGWFSVSGGAGGGWLSQKPKDRIIEIEENK